MATESFVWSDRFLVGYAPMDDTHREFVERVESLLSCPDEQLLAALDAFALHAGQHFGDENRWMESSGFPATQCHVDEHAAVLKSVGEVRELLLAGNVDIVRHLAAELARWFPAHADHMDSALAHWLVKKRTGGAPVVLRRKQDVVEGA